MKLPIKQKTQFSLFYLFVAITVLVLIQGWVVAPRPVEIPMSRFLTLLREGKVEKVSLTQRDVCDVRKLVALPVAAPGPSDRLPKLMGAQTRSVTLLTWRLL